jgi:hypothetical protein
MSKFSLVLIVKLKATVGAKKRNSNPISPLVCYKHNFGVVGSDMNVLPGQ